MSQDKIKELNKIFSFSGIISNKQKLFYKLFFTSFLWCLICLLISLYHEFSWHVLKEYLSIAFFGFLESLSIILGGLVFSGIIFKIKRNNFTYLLASIAIIYFFLEIIYCLIYLQKNLGITDISVIKSFDKGTTIAMGVFLAFSIFYGITQLIFSIAKKILFKKWAKQLEKNEDIKE